MRKPGISLTTQERLEVFGRTRLDDLADEAERRPGATADWTQEQQRTSGYTAQDDWQRLLAESASIHQRLPDAMNNPTWLKLVRTRALTRPGGLMHRHGP